MPERPLFFNNDGYDLFGVLHEPATSRRALPFVLCHPFGEEKLWTHRVFVTFARELAQRGHTVLRFDYMGNGDSDGDFADSSVTTACADIGRAIELVKHRTGADKVALLGLRYGATLAAEIAERRDDIEMLVLWAPIANGQSYMQELLRSNLTTQMTAYREIRHDREALIAGMRAGLTANIDGYEVSLRMFEEVSATKASATRCFGGPCLVVEISRGAAQAPGADAARFGAGYRDATIEVVREEPFWKEIERFYDTAPNLFSRTLDWLAARSAKALLA